jgi:hypothetical protein
VTIHLRASGASFVAVAGVLAAAGCASTPAPSAECDRACLGDLVTDYIDAVVAHDASGLPLADDLRFTENSVDMALGAGTWATIDGVQGFRQDYLDVEKQIAASHFVLTEGVNTILYTALLHLEDGEIAGIETLVQRITPETRFQPTMLGQPLYGMNDPVPEGERQSRESMIQTALTYTEGLRVGTFVDIAPFSDQAYRIENGSFMAGYGCPRESCPDIQTQDIIEHPDITTSIAAVDEENGAVLLWMNFGDTNSYGEGNALVTFEAFKTWGDEIHVVHAFFPILKKETERGWPSSDPVPEWKTSGN